MGNTISKLKNEEKGFTLIELIIVIVILGIISSVAIPKFVGLSDSARLGAARGVGSALGSTIAERHSEYLLVGTGYNSVSIISDSHFSGGINVPTPSGNTITFVSGPRTYTWTYTPRNNTVTASIVEDSSSDFP
jgi:prepilin-type N-terminal cleavage/methylation domain-containing protein